MVTTTTTNRRSSAVESETTPEDAAVHRIADQRTLRQAAQQHFADRTSSSDPDPARGDPVTGDVSREHWIVPMHGLTCDPDGIVQATARRDGTVILDLNCGDSRILGRGGTIHSGFGVDNGYCSADQRASGPAGTPRAGGVGTRVAAVCG